jgi:hypothetical protein
MKRIFFILISAVFLVSCKSKTIVNKPISTTEPIASNKAFFDSISKPYTFDNLKISSKVNAETGQFIPTIDGTFYIENNKKIWANFSFLFMSQARALATPSGIKAYEKINKTYVDSDFSYLNNLLKVNFVDYNALQKLLLGKAFIPVNEKDFEVMQNAQGFSLTSIKNQIIEVNGKRSEYKIGLDYSSGFNLNKVVLEDLVSKNILEIYYNEYVNIGSQKLPKNVKIIIKGKKIDQILIENTKFEFLKMETPFSIPTNYTKTEIK